MFLRIQICLSSFITTLMSFVTWQHFMLLNVWMSPAWYSNAHRLSQMQGMDRRYNGHAWSKLVTTNIKKLSKFSFRKAYCLHHLWCVQDDCGNFVRSTTHNETFWCGECPHILVLSQVTMIPSSSLGCKFCHSPRFCVIDCDRQIYYVVHRFQSMLREAIHLGVHNHLVMDGKCQKLVEETKRTII